MRIALALLIACSSERSAAPPVRTPPIAIAADAAAPIDATIDAAVDVFVDLRARGFEKAAELIEQRVAQPKPKMKLSVDQGRAAAAALVVLDRPAVRELHAVMPRSTVELARAVRERGVSVEEADAIARYLVRVVQALSFERLATFDENHSHVIGRDWPDIDYTGEGMTWQSQRADWEPKGVISFKRAPFIHAYFVGAERLPHWKRVYRPRGRMRDVQAP
ncbi:MAG: hypothetical protein H0T46_30325 [Deltaproteobacteria bacterium]|nr:hypothetical protein [Deltaproteobacteria bacterium]